MTSSTTLFSAEATLVLPRAAATWSAGQWLAFAEGLDAYRAQREAWDILRRTQQWSLEEWEETASLRASKPWRLDLAWDDDSADVALVWKPYRGGRFPRPAAALLDAMDAVIKEDLLTCKQDNVERVAALLREVPLGAPGVVSQWPALPAVILTQAQLAPQDIAQELLASDWEAWSQFAWLRALELTTGAGWGFVQSPPSVEVGCLLMGAESSSNRRQVQWETPTWACDPMANRLLDVCAQDAWGWACEALVRRAGLPGYPKGPVPQRISLCAHPPSSFLEWAGSALDVPLRWWNHAQLDQQLPLSTPACARIRL